jgi:hypothetical protein
MSAPYDIESVDYVGDYKLRLRFADGLITEIDLAERLARAVGPMFEPLRDVTFFAQVRVDHELGTIVWPNGADLAPDVLHEQAAAIR